MNQTIDRRRLLATAALGGVVGATGLGSLAPEAAFAAEPTIIDPGAPDPNFAEGRISKISGNMLLVTGSDTVLHSIRITDGTSLWKLHPTTFDKVAVGDGSTPAASACPTARSPRTPSGSTSSTCTRTSPPSVATCCTSTTRAGGSSRTSYRTGRPRSTTAPRP
ncbi:hypothetical protein GCM10027614_71960 [Micromonospora vulcania]